MKKKIMDDVKGILQQKPEILFAYILGSFLTDDNFNDIDVALYLDHRFFHKTDILKYEMNLSLELEEQIKPGQKFKRLISIDANVINLEHAPVSFRFSVSKGSLLYCRDEASREEFLCRTWKEYADFQYISDQYFREVSHAAV